MRCEITKDAIKEIKKAKKENTIKEIEDLDLTITAFKGLDNFCESTIKRYEELRTRRKISKELALKIISEASLGLTIGKERVRLRTLVPNAIL